MLNKISAFLLCAFAALNIALAAPAVRTSASDAESAKTQLTLRLWYDEPASDWEQEALPIGNGYMGAMVFGKTDTERLQLNEKTLWTGGPRSSVRSGTNADKYGNANVEDPAETMRRLVDSAFNNFYSGSKTSVAPKAYLPNNRDALGNYQNFAETYIDFNHADATEYRRYLDLNTAVAGVSYVSDGVKYTREMFANYPDNVMVYRISASESGALNFTLRPVIPHMTSNASGNFKKELMGKTGTVTAEGDTVTLKGSLKSNGMLFEGQYKVVPDGGSMSANGSSGSITVSDADGAYIIIALGTSYVNDYSADYVGEDPHENVTERIAAAAELGYEKLYDNHVSDYRELFDRVVLDLGEEFPDGVTTDKLMSDYRNGNRSRYLETLYFQFGRYLLISSSRDGSLPANLQGVWNESETPSWQSDYHTNINLQMNYWPAMSTNLAETMTPLVDFVDSLRVPGRVTFENTWGIKPKDGETESGFVVNSSCGPMGYTGNINSNASFAVTGAAFIGQNLYDYYAFGQDREYLGSRIYPILKEMCNTYVKILEPGRTAADKDKLYVAPSFSPEQGPWTVGAYFDQQLVYQLFKDTTAAAEVLGVDGEFSAMLEELMQRLDPVEIGASGQIKEWQQEDEYGKWSDGTWMGRDNGKHRHISQLVALYPGNIITAEDEELMNAAKVTLTKRGDEATGWSMGHKLNLWARTGDGNHAYKLLTNLISDGTYDNLFDTHPPFQIDGNFGGTAGIAEMLLQSQTGVISVLPALPDEWKSGSFSGLVARGNFETDVSWVNGEPIEMKITSRAGNVLKLSAGNVRAIKNLEGEKLTYTESDGVISLDTVKGETYTVETFNRYELYELAETAKEKSEYEYTAASYASLAAAAEKAEAVLADDGYTEKELDDAISAMRDALNGLVGRGREYSYAIETAKYADVIGNSVFAEADGYDAVASAKEELISRMAAKDADGSVDLGAYCDAVMSAINGVGRVTESEFIDDQSDLITYGYPESGPDAGAAKDGLWYTHSNSKYTNGNVQCCRTVGAWFSMEFTGTRIEYLTEFAKGGSLIDIYIDDVLIASADTHDPGNGLPGTVAFDSADYPELVLEKDTTHTIKIVSTALSDGGTGGGFFIRNEGFRIYDEGLGISDKTQLVKAVAEAGDIDLGSCGEQDAAALTEALDGARAVIADADADAESVAAATEKLRAAMENIIGAA